MGIIKKDRQKKEEAETTENREYQFPEEAELKECRHCRMMIPKAAKVCPNCKKRQKTNWAGLILLILLLAACGAGAYYYLVLYPARVTVSAEAVEGTENVDMAEGVDIANVPEAAETVEGVDMADAAEAVETAEGVDIAEAAETAEGVGVAETAGGLDAADTAEAVDMAEGVDMADAAEVVEGVDMADMAEAAGGVDVADTEEAVESGRPVDVPGMEGEQAAGTEQKAEGGQSAERSGTAENMTVMPEELAPAESLPEFAGAEGLEQAAVDASEAERDARAQRMSGPEKNVQVQKESESEKNLQAGNDSQAEKESESEELEKSATDLAEGGIEVSDYTEEEFRALCQRVDYKKLLRSQETYLNAAVMEELTVMEQVDGGLFDENIYYLCKREDGQGITRYYIVRDDRAEDDTPILAGDVIWVYGQLFGSCKLPGYLVKAQPVVPAVTMVYFDLVEE